jgi:hypothetical protein
MAGYILQERGEIKGITMQDQTPGVANNLQEKASAHAAEETPGFEADAMVELCDEHHGK